MNTNQNDDDILNIEELLTMTIKAWKALIVISLCISFIAFLYCRLTIPLYQATAVLIPGGTAPQPSSSLLAAFGAFPTSAFGTDNSEKIKLYATSSQVLQNVLAKLDSKTFNEMRAWLNSRYFGMIKGKDSATDDLRVLGLKMAKNITLESPPDSVTAIQISIETPSAETSMICLKLLLEEIRNFYNESEQTKLKKQELFFQNVSENYRKQMLKYSLDVSHLPNPQNGLIELLPEDLDLSQESSNIRTTPQSYFEYKSTMQDMYKTFAKSLEQSFQSLRIDAQRQELLFDLTESPYTPSAGASSPNTLKVCVFSAIATFFIFSYYVF